MSHAEDDLPAVAAALRELAALRAGQLDVLERHLSLHAAEAAAAAAAASASGGAAAGATPAAEDDDAFAEHLPRLFAARGEQLRELHASVERLAEGMRGAAAAASASAAAADAAEGGAGGGDGPSLVRVPAEAAEAEPAAAAPETAPR